MRSERGHPPDGGRVEDGLGTRLRAFARWAGAYRSAVAVLALTVVFTVMFYAQAVADAERESSLRFAHECDDVAIRLGARLDAYAGQLLDARGFFAASNHVDRSEWRAYFDSNEFTRRFPGAFGLAFVERVPMSDVDRFVAEAREEGVAEFRVHVSPRADLDAPGAFRYIVKYHEPLEVNRSALGLDVSMRREARARLDHAMRTGALRLSEPLTLTRDGVDHRGVVMVLPVYQNGKAVETELDRVESLAGWVAAPISLRVLFASEEIFDPSLIGVSLRMESTSELGGLLHLSDRAIRGGLEWVETRFVAFGGKRLRIDMTAVNADAFAPDYAEANIKLIGGLIVSVLLGSLAVVLTRSREHAERRAADAERDLRVILDAIPGFVYYKDANSVILDLNRAAADSIGLPRDEIKGRSSGDFFLDDDVSEDLEVLASGEPRLGIYGWEELGAAETRHISTDKIPLRGAGDECDRLVVISTDVTELTEAHQQAARAEDRLSLAMKSANIGLWDWDIPTGETYFSDTFYTMLGYEPGELPMHVDTWKSLVHPEDHAGAMEQVRRHFDGQAPVYSHEYRMRRKDGGWLWIRDVGELVEYAEDGSPKRMTGVHVDVQALRDAVMRAEEASNAKSSFLANMSHEIRTPMTAILGYADLLASDRDVSSDPERAGEAVGTIQSNANHLLTIINDILDVSKIESGRANVERIDVNPARVAQEVIELLSAQASGKGIGLGVFYDTPIPSRIVSDPTRLRQILLNLAGNAVKFTETGRVDLRLAHDPRRGLLECRVVDTGIGMTPAQRDEIARFEAFNQADSSTTRDFGGTGLGLRISNAFAGMLGGGLDIESEYGKGSVFTVTAATGDIDGVELWPPGEVPDLAALRAEDARRGARQVDGRDALAGVRILLVEDGPDNQRLIAHHLKKAGADVTVAEDGLEAVQFFECTPPEGRPHAVLMDMQMPRLDGYGATRRLREMGVGLPVIALTALAMDGDRERCFEAGCDDYLSKPIDKHALIGACARWAAEGGVSRAA